MNFFDERTLKKILYTFFGVLCVATIVLFSIYIWYGNKVEDSIAEYSLETEEYEVKNDTKEASSTSDKNIQSYNSTIVNITNTMNNNENTQNTENKTVNTSANINNTNDDLKKEDIEQNEVVEEVKEEKKDLDFDAPVDGEIIKDFANETLIYSKTLDEWTTHLGIDIKGDKTSIVKSSESGVVESIKNDPRYGLTITIVHQDGFKTVYSNLLTTEFVKEGDTVDKGDTIATIGETASFEILDESHLHFEMYKDEVAVNPTLYLK